MPLTEKPLGAKLFSFAVISDTHVNPDEDKCNSPFPVNARANRRFRHVAGDINQRGVDFVIHLGDLVHPVPDTGSLYHEAASAYRNIAAELTMPVYAVPGNHDIGDTPVRGAPAGPTTPSMIQAWEEEFGAQYQSFEHGGIRFVLLNAQLINSGLPEEAEQKVWAEAEIARPGRTMLMLHHPAYLCSPDEAPHYDNTDPPGRQWLLDLLEQHGVEAMFSGHAHNFWYDRYKKTDYYLAPATSFVRQDYSEMFSAPPPADSEFGRDDKAKLGYFVVSVHEAGHAVQFVRTFGQERAPGESAASAAPLAAPPRSAAPQTLGFDLRRNWAEIREVPPSGALDEFDRKPVRNDYMLLALIEMGVRDIRIPFADLRDPVRRRRLGALCHLGLRPTLFSFGVPPEADLRLAETASGHLRDWEITLDWQTLEQDAEALDQVHARTGLPLYLSRMRTKADLADGGIYYHVINHGFSVRDSEKLDQLAALGSPGIAGAVFRIGLHDPVEASLSQAASLCAARGLKASAHLRMAGENPALAQPDPALAAKRLKAAEEALRGAGGIRVFCDTLVAVDRGYYPRSAVLDTACNPSPDWPGA
jgi:3',5'-cyclic AMP phosphodiesterase CpdA